MTDIPLTDEEFLAGLHKAVEWVQTILANKRDPVVSFLPTLFLQCTGDAPSLGKKMSREDKEDGDPYIVMAMMPDLIMDDRHKALEAFGHKLGGEGVLVWSCFFIAEAWVSSNVKHPAQPRRGGGKYKVPSDDPERKEVILVAGMSMDQRVLMGQVFITRNKRDQMVLGETKIITQKEGEMQNGLGAAFFRGLAVGFLSKDAELN